MAGGVAARAARRRCRRRGPDDRRRAPAARRAPTSGSATETLASDLDVAFDGPPSSGIEAAARGGSGPPTGRGPGTTGLPVRRPGRQRLLPLPRLPRRGERAAAPTSTDIDRPRVLEGRVPDPEDRGRDRDHRDLRRRVRSAGGRSSRVRVVRAGAARAAVHHRRRRPSGRAALHLRRHGDLRRADVPERELGRLPAPRVPDARVRSEAWRQRGHVPRGPLAAPARRQRRCRQGDGERCGRCSWTRRRSRSPRRRRSTARSLGDRRDRHRPPPVRPRRRAGRRRRRRRRPCPGTSTSRGRATVARRGRDDRVERVATQAITWSPSQCLGAVVAAGVAVFASP